MAVCVSPPPAQVQEAPLGYVISIVAENAELFNIILRGNGKEFHYTQTWNEELGVDFFQFKGWEKPVPILFTGMLSVLNNGSYYSLRWHIRHILRSLCR